jgi:adenylate cyclase class 2
VIESEIKIPVDALDAVRELLLGNHAERLTAKQFEANTLFDTAQGELLSAGSVLRIREVGERSILTYKGPASWQGAVKLRHEVELDVSSSAATAELLRALGFVPWMRYEKERESWAIGEVRIELDHTPVGDFVELEGPTEELESTAEKLKLDPSTAVAESYIGLWMARRKECPDLGRDMVFEP